MSTELALLIVFVAGGFILDGKPWWHKILTAVVAAVILIALDRYEEKRLVACRFPVQAAQEHQHDLATNIHQAGSAPDERRGQR